jgi:hypothetical protein
MKLITGDMFELAKDYDAMCITTNGFRKENGQAVMGRGCAKTAAEKWPSLPLLLGNAIKQNGNKTQVLQTVNNVAIVAFPTKKDFGFCAKDGENVVSHMAARFKPGTKVPGWALKSDYSLIELSTRQLSDLANQNSWKKVILPRPGTGAGELDWNKVESILSSILDDRFDVVTF